PRALSIDKAQGELPNQPQNDLGEGSNKGSFLNRSETDVPRAEHPAGSLGLVPDHSVGTSEPREKKVRPLESDYSGSDRGISADDRTERSIIFQIETDKIAPNPHQPRRDFDEQSLQELANSVREFGVIQPLIVTKIERESSRGWDVSYELVAGERRLMASKIVGLRTVPAIIRQVPRDHEKLELAITENVQRTNLNPIEFARAIARLQEEFKLTQREIATRLGKSREAVANSVRLLSLPSEVQEAVSAGKVSESQARLLLSVDDVAQREKLFQEIMNGNLTVREISSRVRQWKGRPETETRKAIDPELLALKEELETALGAPVELKREGEGGKLTINFYSKEELEGILAKFKQNDSQSL
ncbi:MAG: ParB/RepB/Spo0J family partition protein, partial [bacterium]|nr:ParB/RepB/Spo0J family partition protein [bacterium]